MNTVHLIVAIVAFGIMTSPLWAVGCIIAYLDWCDRTKGKK